MCCSLVPLIYGRMGLPQQLILRGILDRHLKDMNVRLRCTTMHALAKVAMTADAYTAAWLVRLCQRAVGDGEEAVRATAIDSCAQVGNRDQFHAFESTISPPLFNPGDK